MKKDQNAAADPLFNEYVRVYESPKIVSTLKEFNVIEFQERYYGLAHVMGQMDFKRFEHKGHPAVISGDSREDVERIITETGDELREELTIKVHPKPVGEYRSYNIVEYLMRYYGVPHSAGRVDFTATEERNQSCVLRGDTREEVERLIDGFGVLSPEFAASTRSYDIMRYGRYFYCVHRALGKTDLTDEKQRNNLLTIRCRTLKEAQELAQEYCVLHHALIRAMTSEDSGKDNDSGRAVRDMDAVRVEYTGWIPTFENFGNCGKHPQFTHLDASPEGYEFVFSEKGAPPRRPGTAKDWLLRVKTLSRADRLAFALIRLSAASLREGATFRSIAEFVRTRDVKSQLLLPRNMTLAFLPSVTYTLSQHPWVIEVEDTTSMFFPFLHNGRTEKARISGASYFKIIKALLETDNCRGIITHIKSTADSIPALFGSDKITAKVMHQPLGVKLPEKLAKKREGGRFVNLLFTNSWHQNPVSFFLRGGLDLLEAFDILDGRYNNLRLTMRTSLPDGLDGRYRGIMERGNVSVINYFLSPTQMQSLFDQADIFVLPSARIHVVSILEAMANGLAVVVSDGWGIEEYVTDGRSGAVIKGRYGKVSWIDPESGVLRENYEHMFKPDPVVVERLVAALTRLIESQDARARLGRAARGEVENRFNLANWNRGLKAAFDRALGRR